MCVTSPPYFGLRDYGHDGQIGLEESPDEYVQKLVEVFREVRRVLRDDGILFLNLGDSYASIKEGNTNGTQGNVKQKARVNDDKRKRTIPLGLKPKDLIGIPWRVAFALQQPYYTGAIKDERDRAHQAIMDLHNGIETSIDYPAPPSMFEPGWYLRQDVIWSKKNPMPESVTDRCTKAHEYLFLLTKSAKYYFDNEAIKEPSKADWGTRDRTKGKYHNEGSGLQPHGGLEKSYAMANKRSVWTINTKPYKGAHFAVFPEALVEPCVLAGSKQGDIVLDPFCGSGTTLAVAKSLGRQYLGVELNPEYIKLAEKRIAEKQKPLL